MNWLIAEDEADIRNLVATMCQIWGHNPLTFENGQKAWDFLDEIEAGTNSQPLPEFALMDIRMPGYRGDQIATRIRTVKAIKDIPVVLMTAFVLSDEERDTMKRETGVDHIMNKPLPDFMDLKAQLEQIIADKQKAVAATATDTPKNDTAKDKDPKEDKAKDSDSTTAKSTKSDASTKPKKDTKSKK